MFRHLLLLPFFLSFSLAQEKQSPPSAPRPTLEKYQLPPAPQPTALLLQKDDRLAICGDSITEQKMYSLIIDTYLTACLPELGVTCRQYGWSGEKADGFLNRMDNDVLRFKPTIATTCYGMNDHRYVPFTTEIGDAYRKNMTAIAKKFQANSTRIIIGSSGTIASVPHWVKTASGTWEDLNLSLNQLRNIALEVATTEKTGFADLFSLMLDGMGKSTDAHGDQFFLSGKDGVHPGWAGQTFMAYAFLKAMGVDGDLGSVNLDIATGKAEAEKGHTIISSKDGIITVESKRYPFCYPDGDPAKDDSIRAGRSLLPFDQDINRFTFQATGGTALAYDVTWGEETKRFTKEQLANGINLAAEFDKHPLRPAFLAVMKAVGARQEYETYQIKKAFRSPEAKADMEKVAASTEKERAPLAEAVAQSVKPVTHQLVIKAVP